MFQYSNRNTPKDIMYVSTCPLEVCSRLPPTPPMEDVSGGRRVLANGWLRAGSLTVKLKISLTVSGTRIHQVSIFMEYHHPLLCRNNTSFDHGTHDRDLARSQCRSWNDKLVRNLFTSCWDRGCHFEIREQTKWKKVPNLAGFQCPEKKLKHFETSQIARVFSAWKYT